MYTKNIVVLLLWMQCKKHSRMAATSLLLNLLLLLSYATAEQPNQPDFERDDNNTTMKG